MGLVGNVADTDQILTRCVALAAESLEAGDHPFGSVLVAAGGHVLAEDRNRVTSLNDPTYHPEIRLVTWAIEHLDTEARAGATVYTSGEHCPMCSSAHAMAGLGPIVTIATSDQFVQWQTEAGATAGPVTPLTIREIAPGIRVTGPIAEYNNAVRDLYMRYLELSRRN